MSAYPVLEQDGFCASVLAEKGHGGRWKSWVRYERDSDFARLKAHGNEALPVPNSFPSEAAAVQAAYDHARVLIAREMADH